MDKVQKANDSEAVHQFEVSTMCYDCRLLHFLVYRRVTLHLVVSRRVLEPPDLTIIFRYDDRL
jgi:hypothetical protein